MKNIFISFPYDEAKDLKEKINNLLSPDLIFDYSEKEDRSDKTDENIWSHLYKRIKGSSITIVIHDPSLINSQPIGKANYDKTSFDKSERFHNSGWIYKEIVASLRSGENNQINGIIYLIPNKNYDEITLPYSNNCQILDSTKIPEIILKNSLNHKKNFISHSSSCNHVFKESYIVIVKEIYFFENPKYYIDMAYKKREKQISNKEYEIINNLHLN